MNKADKNKLHCYERASSFSKQFSLVLSAQIYQIGIYFKKNIEERKNLS